MSYEIGFSNSAFRKNTDAIIKELMKYESEVEVVSADVTDENEVTAEKEDEKKYDDDVILNAAGVPILNQPLNEEQIKEENAEGENETVNTKLDFSEPTELFSKVDKSYFDDALFLGDSRTTSLQIYGNLTNATYYTAQGTSIWYVLDQPYMPDETITIEQAISMNKFKKIYMMLGINEMGTGSDDEFLAQYKAVIEKIRKYQPDAIIFVQAIFHVSKETSDTEKYITNPAINQRNLKLATLADNKTIFFLDANKVLDDENGALSSQYSKDGVHLTANKVSVWQDFLFERGVITD